MVHHTISKSSSSARSDSKISNTMHRLFVALFVLGILGLAGCAQTPPWQASDAAEAPVRGSVTRGEAPTAAPLSVPLAQPRSHWSAVPWSALPGFEDDSFFEAWNAWVLSCEKAVAPFLALCADVRRLSIGSPREQREWMMSHLQPYQVQDRDGNAEGLLTAYFEPVLEAARRPEGEFSVPLFGLPQAWVRQKPWYTRQEVDTQPAVRGLLSGREIVFVSDPLDALIVQIQGSARMRVRNPDGSVTLIRLAYAGSNEQPYRSVGRWLLDQGLVRDASWPAIKAWAAQNPGRVQEMLWSNPRVVFFREMPLSLGERDAGPIGAQGVALTAGRSVAVDPLSIPYGAALWLSTSGASATMHKLVLAQDTGSAITGAVRVDYFAGVGPEAGDLAGRLKQPVRIWVLWPK